MIQRCRFIDEKDAHSLLERIGSMTPDKHGVDGRVYLLGEYAVVHTNRLKLRNAVFHRGLGLKTDEAVKILKKYVSVPASGRSRRWGGPRKA